MNRKRLAVAITGARGAVHGIPPAPAFYACPASFDDAIKHTVGRVLDLFDVDHTDLVRHWEGLRPPVLNTREARNGR